MRLDVEFSSNDAQLTAELGEYQMVYNGQNGATYTPHVSEDGVLSWTNDRDNPNPKPVSVIGPVGPQGKQGEKGDTGEDGVSIVSVQQTEMSTMSGDPNTLTVTLSDGKTAKFVVHNGRQGIQGERGLQGIMGPVGPTGLTGPKGVSVSRIYQSKISGSDGGSNVITAVLDNGQESTFIIKNGNKGSDGADGARGSGILQIETTPSYFPISSSGVKYRIPLSKVIEESGASEVRPGDTLLRGNVFNRVVDTDNTYAFLGEDDVLFPLPADGAPGPQGEQGPRGTGYLKIDSHPSKYTTEVGGFAPQYRMLLSEIAEDSGIDGVLVGDILTIGNEYYVVGYVDEEYAYTGGGYALFMPPVSPTIAVEDIDGGHRVTITDVNGTQSFDVLDGADGEGGGGKAWLKGTTEDVSPLQVVAALVSNDQNVQIWYTHPQFGQLAFSDFIIASSFDAVIASGVFELAGDVAVCQLMGGISNNAWVCTVTQLAKYGDGGTFDVTATMDADGSVTIDKSGREIADANQAGATVRVVFEGMYVPLFQAPKIDIDAAGNYFGGTSGSFAGVVQMQGSLVYAALEIPPSNYGDAPKVVTYTITPIQTM